MKYGIQLYGILGSRHSGIMEILRELYGLGFGRIEVCISLEPVPGMEHIIWPLEWFEKHAWEIRNIGLEVISAHIFTDKPALATGRLKRLAAAYGSLSLKPRRSGQVRKCRKRHWHLCRRAKP